MTDEEKEALAAEQAEKREAERLERQRATEVKRHAEIQALWEHIPEDKRRIFNWIHNAIMNDSVESAEFTNATRQLHFREIKNRVRNKEAAA